MNKKTKKKILITGGSGFVGANLIRTLLKTNRYEVVTILRKESNTWRIKEISSDIKIFKGYLGQKSKLIGFIQKEKPDVVIHLATYGAYPNQQDPLKTVKTNIISTINLLEAVKLGKVKHLIIAGSSSEYGKKAKPMKETDLLEPNNFYAAAKAAQTHFSMVYAKMFNLPITVFRFFNIYGPYEESGRLVRSVIENSINGTPIKLASGKEVRDLTFVDDVSQLIIKSIGNKKAFGEIFNIGTGIQTSIYNLAKKVVFLSKSSSKIMLGVYPGRQWDTKNWRADIHKTKNILKWRAKYPLEKGLKKTIAWYRKELKK